MLGQYLSGLRWHHYDQQPLPKYFYPSAGSLYPVRLYLRVGANTVTGLAAGRYYYHPDHQLLRIGHDDLPAKQLILQLHGCLDAITPLYGDKAMPFCQLEAGYMLNVLNGCGLPLGLTSETDFSVIENNTKEPLLMQVRIACCEPVKPTTTVAFRQRQSYRHFQNERIEQNVLLQWLDNAKEHISYQDLLSVDVLWQETPGDNQWQWLTQNKPVSPSIQALLAGHTFSSFAIIIKASGDSSSCKV